MKLTDLHPEFYGTGGPGISRLNAETGEYEPAPERNGVGLMFDCPCGCDRQCIVAFANPLDGGPSVQPPGWQRTGDTFETLTLTPSILRISGCPAKWHGFITDGEIRTC